MADISAGTVMKGFLFLKSMYAKYYVKDEELKKTLIDEFGRINLKLDKLMQKELAAAHKHLADGLCIEDKDQDEADRLFVEAQNNSVMALSVVENPIDKIKCVQVGVTAILRRYGLEKITQDTAKALVASRLHDINKMDDILNMIKEQIKPGVKTILKDYFGDLAQGVASKLTGGATKLESVAEKYAIMMELCRVYLSAILFFDEPQIFHDTINIIIPSKSGKDPYKISIGYLLLDVARAILCYTTAYEGDWCYHERQLMHMTSMVEFVVNKLHIEDGSKWKDDGNYGTNQKMLECIRTFRFVQCRVVKDAEGEGMDSGKIITNVRKGDEVELIRVERGEGLVCVRRNKDDEGFDVQADCLDMEAVEATFQERLLK